MRAVVFHGAKNIALEDIPEPRLTAGDLLIKPFYAQICTTDVLNYDAWPPEWGPGPDGRPRQRGGKARGIFSEGMVPGHEGGGVVVEVGSAVERYEPGDRVIVDATYHCGTCPECQGMIWRDCRVFNHRHNRPGWAHPTYLGINSGDPEEFGRGLMSELCAVPANMCYLAPNEISDLATVAGEIGGPILTSVRTSGMQLGDNVVQIGGELYGSYRMQLCRLAGADKVIYIEENVARRSWATRNGLADAVIDPAVDDPVEVVLSLLPAGADVVFTSNTVKGSWKTATEVVRRCGTVVPFDSDPRLPDIFMDGFDGTDLNAKGVSWRGDWPPISCAEPVKGGKARNDHQIFIDLMAQRRIDGGLPVTKVVSLWDDIDEIATTFTESWRSEVRTAVRIWGR